MPLGNSHSVPQGTCSRHFATAACGPRRDRHQPFLDALAEHHQERLPGPHRAARQARPARSPAGRSHRAARGAQGCERPSASPLAARSSAASNIRRPRPHRGFAAAAARTAGAAAPTRDRRGASPHRPESRKSAAAPPTAAQPSRAQARPSLRPSSRQSAVDAEPSAAERFRRPVEIVPVGREGMLRGPRFGSHHVEEPVDQRSVVRAITSATGPRRRSSGR